MAKYFLFVKYLQMFVKMKMFETEIRKFYSTDQFHETGTFMLATSTIICGPKGHFMQLIFNFKFVNKKYLKLKKLT